MMLLTDEPELHRAEPKTLRDRLLHTAARITRGQRRVFLRLAQHWPWTLAPAHAFRACGPSRSRPNRPAPPPTAPTPEDHGDTDHRAGALSRPQAGQDHHAVLILSPKAK